MPAPSGSTVFVEFVSGTWTDVTADVDWSQGVQIQVGRSAYQPQPATFSLQFRDDLGKYTPGVAVLTNGTANPYYPNMTVGRRIRYDRGGLVRFIGEMTTISPLRVNGVLPMTAVAAADVTARLGRMTLQSTIETEVLSDSPIGFWPMTDANGSTSAAQISDGPLPDLSLVSVGPALAFAQGASLVGVESQTVKFAATADDNGDYLRGRLTTPLTLTAYTLEVWAKPTVPGNVAKLVALDAGGTMTLFVNGFIGNKVEFTDPGGGDVEGGPNVVSDGGWHHIVAAATSSRTYLYVDGVQVASATPGSGPQRLDTVYVGGTVAGSGLAGGVGPVAVYDYALSADRVAAHFLAGGGFEGETVDQRIARILGYVGEPGGGGSYGAGTYGTGRYGGVIGYTLDTSDVILNTAPQAGLSPSDAIQAAVTSEGGGAVFYSLGGSLTFRNRDFRGKQTTPALTADAKLDLDSGTYQPSMDVATLANRVTVTRATASGNLDTHIAVDQGSVDAYGQYDLTATTYARKTDTEPDPGTRLQEQLLADNAEPKLRLPQVTVDLLAAAHDLYSAAHSVEIGSRIRVTNFPQPTARTVGDFTAEGWTETENTFACQITFDATAADNPRRWIWDTARWQAQGLTLNAGITNSATSVVIAGSGVPFFTTSSGAYPLDIQIDAEILTVTTAPSAASGGTQTLTVTRGQEGTTAAAHSAGAVVNLWPIDTWTL